MKSSAQIENEIQEKNALIQAIAKTTTDEGREPSDEEQEQLDILCGVDGQPGEIHKLKALRDSRLNLENTQAELAASKLGSMIAKRSESRTLVPAMAKRHGSLIAFENSDQGQKDAYVCGKYLMAKVFNHEPSKRFLKEHGVLYAQQDETSTQGLELIPTPLEAAILKRLTMLSNILSKVRTSTMMSQTHKIPDRTAGLTVYYPDENVAITASHETFTQVTLTARKMATLTQISSEVNEDSLISLVDELASDIAYQFALKIEDDIVNGDGTATYGGVTGLAGSVGANSTVTGAGATAAAFTLANYEDCIGTNPFFQGANPEWYCSHAVWANSMLPLLNAAGGTPGSEISGGYQRRFMGFPVNILQTMDDGTTASTDQVYFGDMSQSVFYGQRRGITIATSEHYGFNTDSIWIRGVVRNAITVNNHDTSAAGSLTTIATTA